MNNISSKENRVHSSEIKPFSYYRCTFYDYFNYVPMHWHSEFEINFIHHGMSEFICDDEKFTSSIGDIVIIQPNVMHSIYPRVDTRPDYDTLVFSDEIFGTFNSDRYINQCIKPLINGSMRVQMHITSEHYYYNQIRTIVENIFSFADRIVVMDNGKTIDTNFYKANEIVRPAIEYITNHYNEVITIKQLAKVVHLSESYFMNQFQKYVGLSTTEYISHFRINKACKELINSKKNILEIAFSSGFHNVSNFNRQFKKITGCSPTEYRKKFNTM